MRRAAPQASCGRRDTRVPERRGAVAVPLLGRELERGVDGRVVHQAARLKRESAHRVGILAERRVGAKPGVYLLDETEFAPGLAPHPPHRHVHEEMILIREGTLEVTISGRSVQLGPGSVALVASNEKHGWRHVGTGRARYFVLALGRQDPERK